MARLAVDRAQLMRENDAFHRQSGRDWNFQIVARPFRTASMCRDGADHGEPEVRTIQLSRSIDACRGRAPTSQRSMLKSELLLARAVGRIAARRVAEDFAAVSAGRGGSGFVGAEYR